MWYLTSGVFNLKTQKYNKSSSMIWNSYPKPYVVFYCKTFHICNLLSHWALSNCCDPKWDSFHTPMIKITYTFPPHAMLLHYKWAKISSIHKIKLQVHVWHLSQKYVECTWSWSWEYEMYLTKGHNNLTKLNEITSCICVRFSILNNICPWIRIS